MPMRNRPPLNPPAPPTPPQKEFRWEWVTIPALLLGLLWIGNHMAASVPWSRLWILMGFKNEARATRFMSLFVFLIAVTLIVKVCRRR